MTVYIIFKYGKRFRYAPSFNNFRRKIAEQFGLLFHLAKDKKVNKHCGFVKKIGGLMSRIDF
jgi:hypothetical protein